MTVGYVGTRGTALYQSIDGNPTLPVAGGVRTTRMFPHRGVIRSQTESAAKHISWEGVAAS